MSTTITNPPTPIIVKDDGILMALPAFDRIDVPFVMCYSHLMSTAGCVRHVDWNPGDSLVNRARNNLAHRFLEGYASTDAEGRPTLTQYEWLLFLDTDLIFKAESVIMLYELARERGPGIYAGTYPMKQLKPKIVCNAMPGKSVQPDGTVEVREAGTGFMLIHRSVFETMMEKLADEIKYAVDMGPATGGPQRYMYDFFSVGVAYDPIMKVRRFLSEDWYFCQRWRQLGGKVIMQTKICCNHIGKYAFPGNPNEILDAAEAFKKQLPAILAERDHGKIVSVKVAEQPRSMPELTVIEGRAS